MQHLGRFKCILFMGLYVLGCTFLGITHLCGDSAWAWGRQPGMQVPSYISQEVIVQYRPEATSNDISKTYNNLGLYEVEYSPYSGLRRVRVPSNSSVYTIAANLNQNPSVFYAEPNYLRITNFVPNDPLYKYQWHINNPVMQQVWDLSFGKNVVIAVLDTGIAYRNGSGFAQAPDLAETSFVTGYDFVNDDPYPDDDNRHGTHIAGIIAQSSNNLSGGCGVAPGCTLMPVKVLDKTGSGTVSDIVEAIYYAVNNGAQIINMSYGFVTSPSASEEEAINYAVSQGVSVICSAGNEATNEPHYPSSYEATICVTATKYDTFFANSYSNYGPEVDVCAPGGELDEDMNGDGYPDGIYQQTHSGANYKDFDFYFAEGTSCSSAFVSGIVALMMAKATRPISPTEVREILHSTALDLGEPGWDQFYGWGLINPLAAVQAAVKYTAQGYFLPGIGIQQQNINYPPYQIPNAAYQASSFINNLPQRSVQVTGNNSTYQTNAGFAQIGQAFATDTIQQQPLNPQLITTYQAQGLILPNFWPFYNNSPLQGSFLSLPYQFAPFLLTQNASQLNPGLFVNSYYTPSSTAYQVEAAFSQALLPYQVPQWNSSTIRPSVISDFSNALLALSNNIYPFWLF